MINWVLSGFVSFRKDWKAGQVADAVKSPETRRDPNVEKLLIPTKRRHTRMMDARNQ
jgi:hypothetical protein